MAKYNRRPTDPKKKPKKGTKEYYEWMASKRESDHKKAKEERAKEDHAEGRGAGYFVFGRTFVSKYSRHFCM